VDNKLQVVLQLFGKVGTPKADYSCAVESTILLHGRMYITERFLNFYSNFFGVEKKIVIPLSVILEIEKANTALVIPNALAVKTSRKTYIFRSFWDRDSTYDLLCRQWKDVIGGLQSHEPSLTDTVLHPYSANVAQARRASSAETEVVS